MENGSHNHVAALKRKLLATMILVPMIPFILVVGVGYYYFYTSMEKEISSRMVRIAEDHARVIEMFLSARKSDLRFIADTVSFEQIKKPSELVKVFKNLQAKSPAYVDLGVFNQKGLHVAHAGPYHLAGKEYGSANWFKEVLARGYYISDVFLGYRRVPHFIIAIAVGSGERVWVLRATIDTLFFSEMVEQVRIGKTGEAYIVNHKGLFQTERRSGGDLLRVDPLVKRFPEAGKGVETFDLTGPSGVKFAYAITGLDQQRWILVVRQESADAYAGPRQAAYLVIVIVLIGATVIAVTAVLLTDFLLSLVERADQEKDRLNQQLIVATRLAEIGEMSAGFAHEINNPLQIIRAEQTLIEAILGDLKSQGALPDGEDSEDLLDSVNQIKVQVDRCGSITHSLLNFARQKDPDVLQVDLKQFVPEVLNMVDRKAKVNGVEFKHEFSEPCPQVMADPGQLQQVLLNLLNNAFDAVAVRHGVDGGKVGISIQDLNGRAVIKVSDNGTGISPENLERIFTPFFTTKPVGKGTGLGLPVCFGIIQQMGGAITVQSELNKGTTFQISLPIAA